MLINPNLTGKRSCGQIKLNKHVSVYGNCTMWRPKDKVDDPRYTSASMKQGGGSVMAWACITAKGPGDLVFIDDITEDGSSIMDGNTYRKILSKYIEPNGKNLLAGTSLCSLTTTRNILQRLPKSSLPRKSGKC